MSPEANSNMKGRQAIVVLGHGSRAADSGRPLEWVVERLSSRLDCPVAPAFLQFNEPGLAECCRRLAREGARQIFISPYFLFEGNHMLQDIPEEVEALKAEYPEVTFKLAGALGTDELLVRLVAKRLEEAGMDAAALSPAPAGRHPIEGESFAIIDELIAPDDVSEPRYAVARRVVHATGDPALADALGFSPGAIEAAAGALASGARIFCDVNMVAAGIGPTAGQVGLDVTCGIATEEAARMAASEGITRGAAAFRRSYIEDNASLDGAVVVIGNAPTALFEVLRLAREEGATPALVIGVPVGFVGASESKAELARSGLEYITLPGNRGGSNIAAAIFNALVKLQQDGGSDGAGP